MILIKYNDLIQIRAGITGKFLFNHDKHLARSKTEKSSCILVKAIQLLRKLAIYDYLCSPVNPKLEKHVFQQRMQVAIRI